MPGTKRKSAGSGKDRADSALGDTLDPLPDAQCPFTVHMKPATKAKMMAVNMLEKDMPVGEYEVRPLKDWLAAQKYNNFQIQGEKFSVGDYVFINNKTSLDEEVDTVANPKDFWIARVAEIRAQDPSHVFLRVYWCYWPEELPSGRQYYHADNELVPSSSMDVVDALSVSGKADVAYWSERDEDEIVTGLFFRQLYDHFANKTSPLREHCVCKKAYNPDRCLYLCDNCQTWLHDDCLEEQSLKKAFAKYERDNPGVSPKSSSSKSSGKNSRRGRKKSKAAVPSNPWDGILEAAIEAAPKKTGVQIVVRDSNDKIQLVDEGRCLKCQNKLT